MYPSNRAWLFHSPKNGDFVGVVPRAYPPTDFINLQSAVSLKPIGGDNGSDSPHEN